MKAALIALTDRGGAVARALAGVLPEPADIFLHVHCSPFPAWARPFRRLKELLPEIWQEYRLFVFVMASGIAVRQIASLLHSKDRDPAVLVADEGGRFLIPLLSGHLGGANAWAKFLEEKTGALAVITTATDVNGLVAPDEYARRLGWRVTPLANLPAVNRHLLEKGYLTVATEFALAPGHPLRQDPNYLFLGTAGLSPGSKLSRKTDRPSREADNINTLPADAGSGGGARNAGRNSAGTGRAAQNAGRNNTSRGWALRDAGRENRSTGAARELDRREVTPGAQVIISAFPGTANGGIYLVPPVISIGVGCRRGIDSAAVLEGIEVALERAGTSSLAVKGLYSIDLKAGEQGLREAANHLGLPFRTFAAEAIQRMNEEKGLSRSGFVRKMIGVDGVCEAASLLGTEQGVLILPKVKMAGLTLALSLERSLSWVSAREIPNI
ncbi:cobalt-precorrin 5A hydrolase [Acididesulfobacillus acetoxydans]|uniref:Cobalamin biosynthesis protein CbiG n=1 Tax=Acididesulfobacillus acetoxydans TaxID=1561005 RepID=A0A8S0Y3B3_9FIRM|nr:cobalamin biosynthesis protein [Acididesulfobacillus acetoxydans]CAA7601905.1 cobalt-precorrin 5A hydrolase [Acididesulfobacillus acetoxydans]CEJ08251.1 Cobalamin biosynthesis protein CbiG [Acididesulfobacillus acetoxydans]